MALHDDELADVAWEAYKCGEPLPEGLSRKERERCEGLFAEWRKRDGERERKHAERAVDDARREGAVAEEFRRLPLVERLEVVGHREPSGASSGLRVKMLAAEIAGAAGDAGAAMSLARSLVAGEDAEREAWRHRLGAVELAALLRHARSLLDAVFVAAEASGSPSIAEFVRGEVQRVHDGWARRWGGKVGGVGGGNGNFEASIAEVRLWVAEYSRILSELPSRSAVAADGAKAERVAAMADFKAEVSRMAERMAASLRDAASRGAKQGSKEWAGKYYNEVIVNGEPPVKPRRRGGGRKAVFDTREEQCQAMWKLGEEARAGRRKSFANYAACADYVIRRGDYDPNGNPFVYSDGEDSSRKDNWARQNLIKRFRSFCKSKKTTIEAALPVKRETAE